MGERGGGEKGSKREREREEGREAKWGGGNFNVKMYFHRKKTQLQESTE